MKPLNDDDLHKMSFWNTVGSFGGCLMTIVFFAGSSIALLLIAILFGSPSVLLTLWLVGPFIITPAAWWFIYSKGKK